MRYDAKVSTLEDQKNLDKHTMDELYGIVIAYEMRTGQENVGILVVVIDVNPSHGFWTARLIKVFGHEGQ